MIIEWSDEDEAYIVTVPELPGCRTHGKTYEEAVKQAQDAIAGWVESALLDGEVVPPAKTFTYWSSLKEAAEADTTQKPPIRTRTA